MKEKLSNVCAFFYILHIVHVISHFYKCLIFLCLLYSPGRKKADSEEHKAMETKSPGEESDYGGSTEDEQEAEPRPPDPKPPTHGYSSTSILSLCPSKPSSPMHLLNK